MPRSAFDREGEKQNDRGRREKERGEEREYEREARTALYESYDWCVFKNLQEARALSSMVYVKRPGMKTKAPLSHFTILDVVLGSAA